MLIFGFTYVTTLIN